jgi:hypothetical protein
MLTQNVEAHIVPWALPRERIPFRVSWKSLIFDRVEVEVPKDLEIVDVINVDRYELIDNVLRIYGVKQAEGVINYFGVVVASKNIYSELKVSRPIHIRFYNLSEIVYQERLEARIFRPLLEVIEAPSKIIFEEGKKQALPLTMRYIGFGDITITIEGTIKGRLVTRGKTFIFEVLKRLAKVGLITDENVPKELRDKVSVSPEFVRKTTQEILDFLKQPLQSTELDEVIRELRKMLAEEPVKMALEEILYAKVEDIILSMIIDLFDRHPVENVRLTHGETTIETVLEAPVESIELKIHYSDALNNVYPEITIPIQIEVKTTSGREAIVEMPIKIQRWEHKPFLNVKEMPIGTS